MHTPLTSLSFAALLALSSCSGSPPPEPDGPLEQVVHLQHLTADEAVPALMTIPQRQPSRLSVTTRDRGTTLVLSGDAGAVRAAVAALAKLDVPPR